MINGKNVTLPYDGIRSLIRNIGQHTKYYINCKKHLGLHIRDKKVFLQDAFESYSLLLLPTCTLPSDIKTNYVLRPFPRESSFKKASGNFGSI